MTQREILAAVEAAAKAAAEAAEAAALAAQAAAEAAEALVAAEEAEVAAEALSETEAVQYSLEKRIHEKLKKMGFKPNLKGFCYTAMAIEMAIADMEVLNGVTKILYPEIAKSCNTTPSRVERAMRHSIERADENKPLNLEIWPEKRPTNSEFIAFLADELRMKMRE